MMNVPTTTVQRARRDRVMPALDDLVAGGRYHWWIDRVSSIIVGLANRGRIGALRRLVDSGNLSIGEHTYGIPTVYVSDRADHVRIGRYCSIAPEVVMVPGGVHAMHAPSTFPFRERWNLLDSDGLEGGGGSIVIEPDAWLCTGSLILSDVSVGVGGVVAAGAVVLADVPPYAIVGGVPATIIGWRCEEEVRKELIDSEWWNWPEWELEKIAPLMESEDISRLLRYLRGRTGGGE